MFCFILSAITPQTVSIALHGLDILAEAEACKPETALAPASPGPAHVGLNRYAALRDVAPHYPSADLGRRFRHARFSRLAA
jgi:hypothetical protein